MSMPAEPYQNRPIRFLDVWHIDDWRMKVYGIAYGRDAPDQLLVDAARDITRQQLHQCDACIEHYHVGFVGIHQGKTGNFVFVDWWANENELHHHVYVSPSGRPAELAYMTPTGLTACTWDLRVMSFERDAWVDCVLAAGSGANIDAYLGQRLNIDA